MRRLRYSVAASLDGYIAGPNGEIDWIVHDPDIDFAALFAQFDTLVMGRVTYEAVLALGDRSTATKRRIVCSRTLRPDDHPDVEVVATDVEAVVTALKHEPGKDIWLFGGGALFSTLAQAHLVDAVEVAVIPVLLGGGTPLCQPPAPRVNLRLTSHRVYGSGIVMLEYDVVTAR